MVNTVPPEIQSYRFGKIEIDGRSYSKDVIIYPDRVRPEWWRERGHYLVPEDLQEIFSVEGDVLIIGQGAYSRMKVPEETRQKIEEQGFKLHVLGTNEAVDLYNQRRDQERVIAALHLTC
ncbi:MAG: Mth938-like domain-containing protein [Anaerolineales bacterium]|jgi:hypothetical protein